MVVEERERAAEEGEVGIRARPAACALLRVAGEWTPEAVTANALALRAGHSAAKKLSRQ